uniref:Uncharacterized protein n=1 Tax=Cannabis sativa TaxID=3483 RepID=A0A803Q4W3_CANSA
MFCHLLFSSVSITIDSWFPLEKSFCPFVVPGLESFKFMVSSLFQVGCRRWDEEVVRDLFNLDEVVVISGMSLSQTTSSDSWYWFYGKIGDYSKLWQLKVPPRTNDLMWRALSKCFLTFIEWC